MDETDFHQQEEDRFAKAIANTLNQRALAGDFDHLFVVAAPRTLGILRTAWHDEVTARIGGEIAKDMTDRTTPDIEAMLSAADGPTN